MNSGEKSGEPNGLLARFEDHAREHGKQTAVVDHRRRLDYHALNQLTNGLAGRLKHSDGAVAALVRDEMAMVTGLLAAQKAGKTFVPLNPTFPEARLASVLRQLQSGVILVDETTAELGQRLAAADFRLAFVDDLRDAHFAEVTSVTYDAQAPAWIIFTSGSTGEPKGVVQSYRNANRYVAQAIRSLDLRSSDRLATASSLTSHAGNIFTLATLSAGATLCLMEPGKRPPAELARWLSDEGVTILGTVPTLLRRLAREYPAVDAFHTLRQLRLSGETVTAGDVALYNRVCPPDCTLAVGYGMTETGGISQSFFNQNTKFPEGLVPVGFAHDEVEFQVVDEQGLAVGVDRAGEIMVISRQLSPGYWQRPDLTEQVFAELPDGRRSFLTGDLGQLRADGSLLHLGRKDSQVQLAGQRVEVAEIEVALRAVSGIRETAVQPFAGPDGQVQLTAYVVLEQAIDTLRIRARLAERLPAHMLPARVIVLDSLPVTGNGKVNRQALPGPGTPAFEQGAPYVAPRTKAEKQMAAIWSELLDVPRVGMDDSFFELGGDSLLGLSLFARIEQEYGRGVPLNALLHAPTVRLLLDNLEHPDSHPQSTALVRIREGGDRPPLWVVHGLWGDLLPYRHVAAHLEPDLPFFGLEASPANSPAHDADMQALAARYVDAIREERPSGPYYLAGYCFGGVVAYEIARKLEEQGQEVAMLAVIDGTAPAALHDARPFFDGLRLKTVREALPSWWRKHVVKAGKRLQKREKGSAQTGSGLMHNNGAAGSSLPSVRGAGAAVNRPPSQLALRDRHRRLWRSYAPLPYGGRIILIRARAVRPGRLLRAGYDPLGGWANLAQGGVDLRFVEGTHRTIVGESNAAGLARELTRLLRETT